MIVTRRVVDRDGTPGQTADQLEAQERLAWELFWGRQERKFAIRSPDYLRQRCQDLHPAVRDIAYHLDMLRRSLRLAYMDAESDIAHLPSDIDIVQDLHDEFGQRFDDIAQTLEDNDIEICAL